MKTKKTISRFIDKNIRHLQEGLFAITLVFIVGGFLVSNFDQGANQLKAFLAGSEAPAAELLEASSLDLSPDAAPDEIVKFEKDELEGLSNDELIENIFTETLIFRILEIAKYVLGGIFALFLGLYVINFISAGDKEEASTKFKDQILWAFTGFIIIALAEPFSKAFILLGSDKTTVDILTDPESLLQSANIVGFSYRSAAHLIQYLLGGIALVTMGFSAFRMIQATGNEEVVAEARKSIMWAAMALIIAGGSAVFVDKVFAPPETIAEQIKGGSLAADQFKAILESGQSQARILALNYVKYFQTFVGAGAVLMLFLAGFKMVSAAGNEEIITNQRKMITWVFMGLAIILISEAFVNVFMPEKNGVINFSSRTAIESFSMQMGGFTNFLLTFSGIVAVASLIVGAIYVTTAVANQEQAEKGKKIILAAALGLIVIISAFALVSTVLSGTAG